MKNMTPNSSSIVRRLTSAFAASPAAAKTKTGNDLKVTLRVEDGILHINNITGKPEGVMYTLMAENSDGTTKLMNRYVALAPFQVYADDIDGNRVLAAWEKN